MTGYVFGLLVKHSYVGIVVLGVVEVGQYVYGT